MGWIGWAAVAAGAHYGLLLIAVATIPTNRRPSSAVAWLLLIAVAPVAGILIFLLIGSPRLPERRRRLQADVNARLTAETRHAVGAATAALEAGTQARFTPHAALAYGLGHLPPVAGSRAAILSDYAGIIRRMSAIVASARTQVHVEFYILAADEATEPFVSALEAAAARGITVRVLMDHLASRQQRNHRTLVSRLERAGIAWRYALPLFKRGEWLRPDLRNHRKIVTVDGAVAITGSLNMIAAGYGRSDGLVYEELCIELDGPAARELEAVFLTDWYSETGERVEAPDGAAEPASGGSGLAQVLPSGSGFDNENNLMLFVGLIHAARRSLTIVTPYFVPDEALLVAVRAAALRGVAVTLVNSGAIDQPLVAHAQRSFYAQLLEAGVDVRLYPTPRLLHAKAMVVDDDIAALGSSNLDMRSFTLNLEVTVLLYGSGVVRPVAEVLAEYRKTSVSLDRDAWLRRPRRVRLLENLARLTSSLQ